MVAVSVNFSQSSHTGDGLQTKYYVNGIELIEGIDYVRTQNGTVRIMLRSRLSQGTATLTSTAYIRVQETKPDKDKRPYYRKQNRREKW